MSNYSRTHNPIDGTYTYSNGYDNVTVTKEQVDAVVYQYLDMTTQQNAAQRWTNLSARTTTYGTITSSGTTSQYGNITIGGYYPPPEENKDKKIQELQEEITSLKAELLKKRSTEMGDAIQFGRLLKKQKENIEHGQEALASPSKERSTPRRQRSNWRRSRERYNVCPSQVSVSA